MTTLFRLLAPGCWRLGLSVTLGGIVVASNMGLLATAAYLIAAASITHLMALLIFPMYAVRLLSAARGSSRYAERMASHRAAFDVLARLRIWLYDQMARLGPSGMSGKHSGDILGRVLADVDELQNAYLLFLTPIAVAMIVTAMSAAILFAFSHVIAWTTLGYIVLCGIGVPAAVFGATRRCGRSEVQARAQWNAYLVDSIQGSKDILTNDAALRFQERGDEKSDTVAAAQIRLSDVAAGREATGEMLAALAMLSVLILAVPLVTSHRLSGLYLAVPALLVFASFEAIRPVATAAGAVAGLVEAGQRVSHLDTLPLTAAVPDGSRAVRPPYLLSFEHVTMRYTAEHHPALQDITLTVEDGAHVAIVGPSGAGKSTLIRLLTGAWQPTAGRICVGGYPIEEYAKRDLHHALGVVAQDTYIFSSSIRRNLRLAEPNATEVEMEEVLDLVGLLDLVRTLPDGLDTWVGEHGRHLSAGERQRLAVARMLLQNTPIVLLDEVTANLDQTTEADLLCTLHQMTRGRTTVMVTHRLIGLDRMDEIVVLDHGCVVERGTHSHLLAANGLYRRLISVQDNILTI